MTDDKRQFITELTAWLKNTAEDYGLDMQADMGELELIKKTAEQGDIEKLKEVALSVARNALDFGEARGARQMIGRVMEYLLAEYRKG